MTKFPVWGGDGEGHVYERETQQGREGEIQVSFTLFRGDVSEQMFASPSLLQLHQPYRHTTIFFFFFIILFGLKWHP